MLTRSPFVCLCLFVVALTGCARGPYLPYDTVSIKDPSWENTEVQSLERDSYSTGWGTAEVIEVGYASGPQAVADTDGPYLLDTGDQLRIFVYGQPNLSRGYTVSHGGTITVPLIGQVHARGKTTRDLQRTIRSRLGAEFVRNPQVTVDIQQNRPFFILGEVRNAGAYPYVSGMTVETAVAIAGGYSERASTRSFRVSRRINGFMESVEVPAEHVIRPGDTVVIHERFL